MDLDRQKLIEYYHALGFLGVEITPEVVQLPDVGHVKVEDTVVVTATACEGLGDVESDWSTASGV